jgi:hypothetical protein
MTALDGVRPSASRNEKEAVEPMTGFAMKYYRWKRGEISS